MMSMLWDVVKGLFKQLIKEKPGLEYIIASQKTYFCPILDENAYIPNLERLRTHTLLVFSCTIQNNGKSTAFITGYKLDVDEFRYSSDNIKPKDHRNRRAEFSEGNPPLLLGPEPKFNTSTGSLRIDAETPLDGVVLPFFINYVDEHSEHDSINATVTLVYRLGRWTKGNFRISAELRRR